MKRKTHVAPATRTTRKRRRARRRRFGPPPIPRPATPEEAAEMRALWEAAP